MVNPEGIRYQGDEIVTSVWYTQMIKLNLEAGSVGVAVIHSEEARDMQGTSEEEDGWAYWHSCSAY